ncbi:MAG: DUF1549 domain-containing protein [Planctomycetales bacterium]
MMRLPESNILTAGVRQTQLIGWGTALAIIVSFAWVGLAAERRPSTTVKAAAAAKPARPKAGAKETAQQPSAATPSESASEDAPDGAPAKSTLPEVVKTGYSGEYSELIDFINQQVRQGWEDNSVSPSSVADDGEWLRRVHLDIVGHIPELEVAQKFLADKEPGKRSRMINRLLEDPSYARNLTAIWTNNLIGRATPRDINRPALQKFLRESFGRNRGWNEVVFDLLAAEGSNNVNGATNFLLSHLNDGAVPATAIASRLFLGMQVQCTQCHNHPFNEWKQNSFWEFNSFFKQARVEQVRKYNEKTGRMDVDHLELSAQEFEGGVHWERRNGFMEVSYPRFNNVDVSPDAATNRRMELARLVTSGERTMVADAMVNRMWGHFFGYGFTKPVDDMGPHNPVSHPVLLERLSAEFVKSGYDLKKLVSWICNSEAYQLTSRFNPHNDKDNPAAGEMPLFSHLYLKSMNAEQLHDSLIVATNAHKTGSGSWEQAESKRQEWMAQFVQTFGTDENDETTSFDGTIPQALMMMNGELMQTALAGAKGSILHQVIHDNKGNPAEKAKLLYLATLTRIPSAKEIQMANRILKGAKNPQEAFQDLYWALLNSNEFIMNH